MADRITSYTHAGLTFEVADQGPLDGEVIVLLHGFPQLNTMWDGVAPLLHAAGYRTIAPNQRGYSPGARPRGRKPYRITELVKDIAVLVAQIGGPVHLVAHDWGAAAGWAAVSRQPELYKSYVAVSVPHLGAFMKAMPRGQLLKSWYMGFFNIPGLPERILTSEHGRPLFQRLSGMGDALMERYWADFGTDRARLAGGLAWYRALALEDPRSTFEHAKVPSTLVWSTGDVALGRAGTDLCEQFVDADYRLEVFSGSHWIPDEKPEELARVILERASSV